jgi:DNA-binding IclR family transcriptional regulator
LPAVPSTTESSARVPAGSQTLARGLRALELICRSSDGLTIQEVAERLGVHRTVASRLLTTLMQFRLIARHGGRYRPGAGLAVLGATFDNNVRDLSLPVLRQLADATRATASLLVLEGDEQVAVAVIVPAGVAYHLSFQEGSRYPAGRGSAGYAMLAAGPPQEDEPEGVRHVREKGWVMTHGEVEPNAWGLAVPVRRRAGASPTAVNLVSHRRDVLEQGRDAVIAAGEELSRILS